MASVELGAPAKVNLHLGVHTEKDGRGYHRVDSLMVSLDLLDRVRVTEGSRGSGPCVVCTPEVGIPQERNTCYRAATGLASALGRDPDVLIEVEKHIPDQAGLGGSSSDAASVLIALARLWDLDLEDERLEEVARATGADVPFFLHGDPMLLGGAGDVEVRRFARPCTPISLALVRPEGPGVSTPAAYAAFDQNPQPTRDPMALVDVLSRSHPDATDIAAHLFNNLDAIACQLNVGVRDARCWLLSQDGVLGGQVSGSGSCVFALCATDEDARRIVCRFRENFKSWAEVAHIV